MDSIWIDRGKVKTSEQPSEEPDKTEFTHEARHARHEPIIIGETNNSERRREQTTPDDNLPGGEDQNNERTLDEESINLMDDDVEMFRSKEITKLKALSNIILNFGESKTEKTKDAAVEYYLHMLNEIEALAASVIK
ncbi:hypothetical protein K443DRAFT_6763 [Laccaria amethystina LaAM-08-1]|uniref:Uncharacterized protein n=1 Tax=Laccaria amethystina LaAM-08-1 TaxID=1095629 RepID=A0A0C9X9B7_9AGAR|nr:hypothetical protein K443DRAFT_6763 [Laccaria amethystina LaAM-08-1]